MLFYHPVMSGYTAMVRIRIGIPHRPWRTFEDRPIREVASRYRALGLGFTPVPIVEGTKVPAVKWKEWQDTLPPEELVREWFSVRRNLAIVTTGMVVFDCDDPDLAERVLAECGDTTHKVRTPRGGMHLGFRRRAGIVLGNQVKIKGLDLDIRTFGGIELIPSSETEHGMYEWIGDGLQPLSELPYGNIAWTKTRAKKTLRRPAIVNSDVKFGNAIVNSRQVTIEDGSQTAPRMGQFQIVPEGGSRTHLRQYSGIFLAAPR